MKDFIIIILAFVVMGFNIWARYKDDSNYRAGDFNLFIAGTLFGALLVLGVA